MLQYIEIAGVFIGIIVMPVICLYALWALIYLIVFGWPE